VVSWRSWASRLVGWLRGSRPASATSDRAGSVGGSGGGSRGSLSVGVGMGGCSLSDDAWCMAVYASRACGGGVGCACWVADIGGSWGDTVLLSAVFKCEGWDFVGFRGAAEPHSRVDEVLHAVYAAGGSIVDMGALARDYYIYVLTACGEYSVDALAGVLGVFSQAGWVKAEYDGGGSGECAELYAYASI